MQALWGAAIPRNEREAKRSVIGRYPQRLRREYRSAIRQNENTGVIYIESYSNSGGRLHDHSRFDKVGFPSLPEMAGEHIALANCRSVYLPDQWAYKSPTRKEVWGVIRSARNRLCGWRYLGISVTVFWLAIWLKTAPLDNSASRSRRHGSYCLCQ